MLCLLCPALSACGGSGDSSTETALTHTQQTEDITEAQTETAGDPLPVKDKRIAFTFDDGPHPTVTGKILDKLAEVGGSATFFVVGTRILDYGGKEALQRIREAGCEIGIHAFSHTENYDECDDDTYEFELRRTKELILETVPDATVQLMRPVGGRITEERVKACPYAVVCWSIDTRDWQLKGRDTAEAQEQNIAAITESIVKDAKDGGIVLMHDMYENTYEAFCRAVDILAAQGYDFVTVSSLLQQPAAGKLYREGVAAALAPAK